MLELCSTKHVNAFERNVLNALEAEFEAVSNQLNQDIAFKSDEDYLWHRYDQLRYLIAIVDGAYTVDPNQKMKESTVITLKD